MASRIARSKSGETLDRAPRKAMVPTIPHIELSLRGSTTEREDPL
jgi:hypothetical protein